MNNYIYLYDGTFLNLILVIQYLLKRQIKPLNIVDENIYQPNLLDATIKLNFEKEETNLYQNLSKNCQKIIYYNYLTDFKNKELVIYYFMLNALKYGPKVIYFQKLKCVNIALSYSHYVTHEAHKLKGFLRFRQLASNWYLGICNPKTDVIFILAKHFQKRLSNEKWIIYDEKRKKLILYDQKNLYFLTTEEILKKNLKFSEEELKMNNLWKTFFKTIGIESRENKKCQQSFMPKRYWENMIEMEDENEKNNC